MRFWTLLAPTTLGFVLFNAYALAGGLEGLTRSAGAAGGDAGGERSPFPAFDPARPRALVRGSAEAAGDHFARHFDLGMFDRRPAAVFAMTSADRYAQTPAPGIPFVVAQDAGGNRAGRQSFVAFATEGTVPVRGDEASIGPPSFASLAVAADAYPGPLLLAAKISGRTASDDVVVAAPVAEPATSALMFAGLTLLGVLRRRTAAAG